MPLTQVLGEIDQYRAHLEALENASDVPAEPDRAWVDAWLIRSHQQYWREARTVTHPGEE